MYDRTHQEATRYIYDRLGRETIFKSCEPIVVLLG